MTKIIVILSFLISLNTFGNTQTPRETMRTFLKSMVKIKTKQGNQKDQFKIAISTLDLTNIDKTLQYEMGKRYAEQLILTLDKIKKVSYENIPNYTEGETWEFDTRSHKNQNLEISITKIDKEWLFSKETLRSLDAYLDLLKMQTPVIGVKRLETLSEKFKNKLPGHFLDKVFLLYHWQWLAIGLILLFSFIGLKIFDLTLSTLLTKYFVIIKQHSSERLLKAIRPLGIIVFLSLIYQTIPHLEFSAKSITVINRILIIMMSCYSVIFGHKVIELMSFYAAQKAAQTENKFDDILVPLLTKTAYVLVYIVGGILIANSLTIDVSGIIAGLGIGGLAFAFAAKDTLANFFGSIMLVLDRPFDIGDSIKAGGIEGIVDEVGFRSTRIRTFNDSLITVSNGELITMPIENLGKRRYRRLVTSLGLEYDTPPEKIEAFCEGIRQLIMNHKWTRKDSFHVYFVNFGASSLDIQVVCYWETADYARELSEKHRLMIDILRLAKNLDVNFAFPTQTVHMFNQELKEVKTIEGEFRDFGRQRAKEVIEKPITLKNPRSNAQDKEQFGDNEV